MSDIIKYSHYFYFKEKFGSIFLNCFILGFEVLTLVTFNEIIILIFATSALQFLVSFNSLFNHLFNTCIIVIHFKANKLYLSTDIKILLQTSGE